MSIHNKFLSDLKQQLDETEEKLQTARAEVNKARSYGDLRENAEYEIAHANYLKLHAEKEKILELLEAPVLYGSNSDTIEPGCIIALKVYGPFKEAYTDIKETTSLREMVLDSARTNQPEVSVESKHDINALGHPNFKGILLFGGLPEIYDFSVGKTMNLESKIGKFINGKTSGIYNVQVPDGFVVVDVCKLKYLKSPEGNLTDTEYSIKSFFEKAGADYATETPKSFGPTYEIFSS